MFRLSKKILKYLIIAVFAIVVLDIFTVELFAHWRPAIKKADAIIVLGAAINTPALYNRTLEALKLYQAGDAGVLVLSGGRISDKDISEAGYMAKVLEKNADPAPPFIIEDQSHNTEDNIRNSKAKIPDAKSVIIVSDEFHLARGVLLAKRAGFDSVSWSSPEPTYYTKAELNRYYVREMVAMIDYIPKLILNK